MISKIIYEDDAVIVCHKKAGIAVQTGKIGAPDMVSELKNYLKNPYLGLVHRLDQPVEGVIVFAKTKEAAAALSKQIGQGMMNKRYYAIAATPEEMTGQDSCETKIAMDEGHLVNYLLKDEKTNLSRVVSEKQGKKAELLYKVLNDNALDKQEEKLLLDITLLTGRHHQIRVQCGAAGMPLVADAKYGNEKSMEIARKEAIKNIALCAYHLEFMHPKNKKKMEFDVLPENPAFSQFLPILEKNKQ